MWMLEFRKARLDLKIPRAIGKRRLVVTRMFCGREKERDYINLVGGMKSVVDALVLEGLLVDDKPAALEDAYRQVRFMAGKALTKGYVRFEISDCEQAVSGAGVST